MELHLVHFNTKYGSSMHEALSNSGHAYNTLAVLGIMFIIQVELIFPARNGLVGLRHIVMFSKQKKILRLHYRHVLLRWPLFPHF